MRSRQPDTSHRKPFTARTRAALGIFAGLFILTTHAPAAPQAPAYQMADRIEIGGVAHWDYMYMDSAARRLYVAHGSQTDIVDTRAGQVIGTVEQTPGVHGIAIAPDLRRGYTSNGLNDTVTVFDLSTFKTLQTIQVGQNPDAIVYVAPVHRVIAFNGRSHDLSVIDARNGTVITTIPLGAKPEYAQIGASGHVFFNLQDTGEIAELDAGKPAIIRRFTLKDCAKPTGLALDRSQRLYASCHNNLMVVTTPDGKHQYTAPIGNGTDGVAWMDGYAFSADGIDSSISVIAQIAPDKFDRVATIRTEFGARTIAADPATHRLYLPTSTVEPAKAPSASAGDDKRGALNENFHLLVVQLKAKAGK